MYAVVIPARNESKRIGDVLDSIKKLTQAEIVVVDDGSSDRTVEVASQYTPHVLNHKINLGKGAALKTGCIFAFYYLNAEAVIFMDSDGQHYPGDLSLFIEKLNTNNDIVLGVRKKKQAMPVHRSIVNSLSSWIVERVAGAYIPDIPCGYKAMTKSAFEKIDWNSADYSVEMEIAIKMAKKKLPFTTVPVKTIYYKKDHAMNLIDLFKVTMQMISWSIGL